jgi:acetyl-CoA carboxylase carboxyl transferase subunit alpha
VIDAVLPEPLGGAHRLPEAAIEAVGDAVESALADLAALDGDALKQQRKQKFLSIGPR